MENGGQVLHKANASTDFIESAMDRPHFHLTFHKNSSKFSGNSVEISKLRSSSFDSASHKELDVNHGQACIVYTKS